MKNIFKKGLKVTLIIFAGILSVILVLLALVLIYSPGKPEQYVDQRSPGLLL